MSFFDKKEEVLEIRLTSYGRRLLAQGKFKPAYYEFFDDDVLYESPSAEAQNFIEDRIFETPRLKLQTVFGEQVEEKKPTCTYSRPNNTSLPQRNIQEALLDKVYFLSSPLGNSQLTKQYAPAWNLQVLTGEISGSVKTHMSSSNLTTIKIPQINMSETKFKISKRETQPISDEEGISTQRQSIVEGNTKRIETSSGILEDGSILEVGGSGLLFSLAEKNVPFEKDNFEIEVFLVEPQLGQKDILIPLSFIKKESLVDDDGFLTEGANKKTEIDETFVEYYFNIEVDSEIDETVPAPLKKNNIYLNKVKESDNPFGDKC